MQWSGDRNAGFSHANPQRLYLPIIVDPEYHYEAINVEAQQNNLHSLLNWTKRLIALRKRYPQAVVEIHPDTARAAGVKEGDMIFIETIKGRIMQEVRLNSELDPRVILPAFGWWYPEEPSTQYDWRKSNINILTNGFPEELSTGAVQLRGIPCRIYKEQ